MTKVFVTDLVLRDGHSRHRHPMRRRLLPICGKLDAVGSGRWKPGAAPPSMLRALPARRPVGALRKLRKAAQYRTSCCCAGRPLGYPILSDDVVRAFVQKSADNGATCSAVRRDERPAQPEVSMKRQGGRLARRRRDLLHHQPVHDIPQSSSGQGTGGDGCDTIAIKDLRALTRLHPFERVQAIRPRPLPPHAQQYATRPGHMTH